MALCKTLARPAQKTYVTPALAPPQQARGKAANSGKNWLRSIAAAPGAGDSGDAAGAAQRRATMGKTVRDLDPQVVVGVIVGVAAALAFIGWALSKI